MRLYPRFVDDLLDRAPGPHAGELRRETRPEGLHATLRARHHSRLIIGIHEVQDGDDTIGRVPDDIDIESWEAIHNRKR